MSKIKTIAITSMYANPLHPGHIECLELSKNLADELWVIVNNDRQAELKRGVPSFQKEQDRLKIIQSLKPVDKVILSIDKDGSVCETLEKAILEAKKEQNSEQNIEIIFTKGGDRFASEIPEKKICDKYEIKIVDGLGEKTHHSSDLIKNKI